MIASADALPPIKARTSTAPVFIMGLIVTRPLPLTKLIAPMGKCFAHASIVRTCAKPPSVGIFSTTTLPVRRAGTKAVYVWVCVCVCVCVVSKGVGLATSNLHATG